MANFTNNYVRNPSAQIGLAGYGPLKSAKITLEKTNILYGNQSALITCPGEEAGEGCILPGGVIPGHSTCSASVYITGSGSVTCYAVLNPGGIIVASTPVTCTGQWQRVKFESISCTPGQTLYLMCSTTVISPCQFYVSGIQVEDSFFAHPYCDGDQDGCTWTEGFWGGVSSCLYENPIALNANSTSTSAIVNILQVAKQNFISASSLSGSNFGLVSVTGPGPMGAVTDFAVSQLTDPDPALTYTSWNNGGTTVTNAGYTRIWSVFSPPDDYLVSNGQYLWNRAAYAAVGFDFLSVPSNATVNLTRVQTEVLPVTTGYAQPAPSAFDTPRAVRSIIKPDRLNFCPNPSIETSASGWSAIGSASVARDNTVSVGQIIEYDDDILTAGVASLKVTVNANGDGAQITIADLITGYSYIASVYVQAGPGFENIVMSIANGSTSVLATGGTGYGTGGYGTGPYGGINPSSDLVQSTWFRINCLFTATADSHVLQITSSSAADVSYPSHIWIDACLVEIGEVLSFYFDGSFGPNYSWETGGTAGLTRSYYYDQQILKQQAVLNILDGHTPLGILSDSPKYSVPYIS
jgi:hypothetical protein